MSVQKYDNIHGPFFRRLLFIGTFYFIAPTHQRLISAFFLSSSPKSSCRGLTTRIHALDYLREESGPFRKSQLIPFWGRQPILIRNAFDVNRLNSSGIWPGWDDIHEWATEAEEDEEGFVEDIPISSRLIRSKKQDLNSFTLELGPFPKSYLKELTSQKLTRNGNWTLILNDVDRIHAPLSEWIDEIFGRDFLPRWRRDDGQISVANTGGGIGPHVDNYDVFLIQTSGSRQWKIGDFISVEEELANLVDDLEVRVLDLDELPNQQPLGILDMRAGDLLYLPPRLVHWGTALSDDCMTLSVGCRAPSASELVSKVAEKISYSVRPSAVQRYSDPDLLYAQRDLVDQTAGVSITSDIKREMALLVADAITEIMDDPVLWDEMLGCILTEPKRPFEIFSEYTDDDNDGDEKETPVAKVLSVISKDGRGALFPTHGVSFATSHCQDEYSHYYRIFADGEKFEMKITNRKRATEEILLAAVERGLPLNKEVLQRVGMSPEVIAILAELLKRGFMYHSESDSMQPKLLSAASTSTLDKIESDVLTRTPVSQVLSVLSRDGKGALYPAAGVKFSTSRYNDEYNHYYTVFADGQKFEMTITNQKHASEQILLDAMEQGTPLTRKLLQRIGLSPPVIAILSDLIRREYMYYWAAPDEGGDMKSI